MISTDTIPKNMYFLLIFGGQEMNAGMIRVLGCALNGQQHPSWSVGGVMGGVGGR